MIIEKASDYDAEIILRLQKTAYQSEAKRYNDYTLPPLLQTPEEIITDFKNQIVLKAVVSGEIKGSVRAYMENKTCFIGRLIVHPDSQKKGIATELMHNIESRFRSADRFELFTGNESIEALSLYYKLGYSIFKRKKLSAYTLVFLEKSLFHS